jgi:serine/threonine-protein kinase
MLELGLGNNDAAIDWIDRSIAERRGWAAYLRVHPIVDPLRGDPRFEQLIKKMTFEATAAPPVVVPPKD